MTTGSLQHSPPRRQLTGLATPSMQGSAAIPLPLTKQPLLQGSHLVRHHYLHLEVLRLVIDLQDGPVGDAAACSSTRGASLLGS